jgi:hypothetical protein
MFILTGVAVTNGVTGTVCVRRTCSTNSSNKVGNSVSSIIGLGNIYMTEYSMRDNNILAKGSTTIANHGPGRWTRNASTGRRANLMVN